MEWSGHPAGNYMYGYNISGRLPLAVGMALAGAYHQVGEVGAMQVLRLIIAPYGPPPYYGETEQAGRRIKSGYNHK